jgi:hypothetical protein
MRTKEEQAALFTKFDSDVQTKSKGLRLAIAFDQLCGVLFWNNSQDETISSKIGRLQEQGKATWWDNKVCCLLSKLDYNHCRKSEGE